MATNTFEPIDHKAITILDLLSSGDISTHRSTFINVILNDILPTQIAAIKRAKDRLPAAEYICSYTTPKMIKELPDLEIKVVQDVTIAPDEFDDPASWKRTFASQSISAGSTALMVDFDCQELAAKNLDVEFFRRSI